MPNSVELFRVEGCSNVSSMGALQDKARTMDTHPSSFHYNLKQQLSVTEIDLAIAYLVRLQYSLVICKSLVLPCT